jgi:hypothetical protein
MITLCISFLKIINLTINKNNYVYNYKDRKSNTKKATYPEFRGSLCLTLLETSNKNLFCKIPL